MTIDFTGKTVLVTGANHGIGEAMARRFAESRAAIALHYLERDATVPVPPTQFGHVVAGAVAAERIVGELRRRGSRCEAIAGDLSDPCVPAELFDEVERRLGPVDVLVNNAAHFENPDTVFDTSAASLDRYVAVNLRAAALLIREFALRYRARAGRSGRVINISTDAARVFATQIGYGATKAALEALTRSTAFELGVFGITVNAIAPGPVQTGYITPALERQLLPSIPLRRIGTPDDIARMVVLFASEAADWMTGQVVQVAGGHAL